MSDEEDAMGWLESLAAKQGAAEEELVTQPEERGGDAPGWVTQSEPEADQPAQQSEKSPAAVEDTPAEDALDWLDNLGNGITTEEPQKEASISDDDLAWLEDLSEGPPEADPKRDTITPEEGIPARESPEWLQSVSEETLKEETPPSTEKPEDDSPEWLPEISAETVESVDFPPQPLDEPTGEEQDVLARLTDTAPEYSEVETQETSTPEIPTSEIPQIQAEPEITSWESESFEPSALPQEIQEKPKTISPKPKQMVKKKKPAPKRNYSAELAKARNALGDGKLAEATTGFGKLVKSGKFIEEIIADMQAALIKYPIEILLWQILGDAYMRADRLQDALDSYTKAEDLLR